MIGVPHDPFPGAVTLCDVFQRTVRLHPHRAALSDDRSELTYAELDRHSAALAHALLDAGVRAGDRVGLMMDRTVRLGVAMLGILRAGAAYVPVDAAAPSARIAGTLADAGVSVAVVADPADAALGGVTLIAATAAAPGPVVTGAPAPATHAYVIYTSGSTGKPKGVLVTHRNVVELLRHTLPLYDVGEDDVWTLFHSSSFDFSVWELWGAWATGARCHVVGLDTARSPAALLRVLRTQRVTVLNQVPTVFTHLVEAYEDAAAPPLPLRYVMFGGERVNLAAIERFRRLSPEPGPVFVNLYGITEITVHATSKILDRDLDEGLRYPIGHALPHLRIAVLGPDHRPVGAGEVGEMWIAGAGVADGYLNRPDLTADRFAELDTGAGPARHYRTGDLARVLPGGELDYVGRNDDQVKVRGFRIEPGEIEAVLRGHPAVGDAVVVAAGVDETSTLVALLVLPGGHGDAAVCARIRAYVAERLPAQFHPGRFTVVPFLPQTASGKLDRAAATRMAETHRPAGPPPVVPGEPAGDGLAPAVARRAAELLGLERLCPGDDLRDLGLDSLGAVRLARTLFRRDGVRLDARLILRHGTPTAIAAAMASTPAPEPGTVPDGGPRLTDGQVSLWLDDLFRPERRLANVVPLAYHVDGPLDPARLTAALVRVVERHDALRTAVREDEDGAPAGVLLPAAEALRVRTVNCDGDGDVQDAADELAEAVDLATGPLISAEVRPGPGAVRLLVAVHHAAFDGRSEPLLLEELDAVIAGRELPEPVPYQRFARSRPEAAVLPGPTAWTRRLRATGPLRWPRDPGTAPPAGVPAYDELDWSIPPALLQTLASAAGRHRVTPFLLALHAFGTAVRDVTGAAAFCVGVPTAGRDAPEFHDTIGYFVTMAVVPFDEQTFAAPIAGIRTAWQEAQRHTDVPLPDLARACGAHTGGLFRVQFVWQHHGAPPPSIGGAAVRSLPIMPLVPQYDLTAEIWPDRPSRGRFGFDADIVPERTAARLRDSYLAALRQASAG